MIRRERMYDTRLVSHAVHEKRNSLFVMAYHPHGQAKITCEHSCARYDYIIFCPLGMCAFYFLTQDILHTKYYINTETKS